MANEVFSIRIVFQQAVEEVQPVQVESLKALEALNSEAKRYIAEGFEEVAAKVQHAWQLEAAAQALLDASRDADGYKEAVTAFKEAVSDVQTIVDDSKAALQKKEAERHARSELQETLNHFERSIQDSKKDVQATLIKHLGDARGPQFLSELESLSDQVAAAGKIGEDLELKDLRNQVEDLRHTVSKKVNEITDLMKNAQQERKHAFAKRMGMFNKAAPKEEEKKEPLVSPYDFL